MIEKTIRRAIMTPERWREIEELYHSARERGAAALAGADPELRREVERLLAEGSGERILRYALDIIDPWEMTITPVPGKFEGKFKVKLPAREGRTWASGAVLGDRPTARFAYPLAVSARRNRASACETTACRWPERNYRRIPSATLPPIAPGNNRLALSNGDQIPCWIHPY